MNASLALFRPRGDRTPRSTAARDAALLALVILSACTAPLFTLWGVTLTGDRIAGLGAVIGVLVVAWRGALRWTPVHSALAIFAGVQVLTSLLAAARWAAGPRFACVYILGFACFVVAAECAGTADGARRGAAIWIWIGAALGVVGAVIAFFANLWQTELWGSALAQGLPPEDGASIGVFAAKVTLSEHNLYSSFLLVPLALSLWRWRDSRVSAACAVAIGLAFGLTRAAWIGMAALAAWWIKSERPAPRHVAMLLVATAVAFIAQAVAIGRSPLLFRVVEPSLAAYDWNLVARMAINRATLDSWLGHPFLGNGAGSVNGLTIVLPNGVTLTRPWTGNGTLFVLHDSGVVGLAALLAVVITAGWLGWRGLRLTGEREARAQIGALLAAGVALVFAYQFTHALWLMYPYVYLGLFTASASADEFR